MNHFIILTLLIICPYTKAQTVLNAVPAKPAYARLLNDENAYAYYHKDWRRLEDKLINHQNRTGNQLVIVIISSLHGYAIEDMALQIFRSWGIGNKELNTGLLVLIAREEKQIKIETGYGLEGQVTDWESGRVIRNILQPGLAKYAFQLPPARPDKAYLPALEAAIDTLIGLTSTINTKAIENTAAHKKSVAGKRKWQLVTGIITAIAFLILLKVLWRLLNNKLSTEQKYE